MMLELRTWLIVHVCAVAFLACVWTASCDFWCHVCLLTFVIAMCFTPRLYGRYAVTLCKVARAFFRSSVKRKFRKEVWLAQLSRSLTRCVCVCVCIALYVGLGWHSDNIGTLLMIQGITFFVWQFIFYKPYVKWLGLIKATAIAMVGTPLLSRFCLISPTCTGPCPTRACYRSTFCYGLRPRMWPG